MRQDRDWTPWPFLLAIVFPGTSRSSLGARGSASSSSSIIHARAQESYKIWTAPANAGAPA